MPEELHAALARASEREGVSLNAYITGVLGEAVEERPPGGGTRKRAPGASTSSPAAPRARGVSRLLVVNLVVVAIVGVLAVVLLVQALR
jgi:HicB family